jgi:hypothetical protein
VVLRCHPLVTLHTSGASSDEEEGAWRGMRWRWIHKMRSGSSSGGWARGNYGTRKLEGEGKFEKRPAKANCQPCTFITTRGFGVLIRGGEEDVSGRRIRRDGARVALASDHVPMNERSPVQSPLLLPLVLCKVIIDAHLLFS